jgi:hypothetical protein
MNKSKLIALFATLFLTHNICAIEEFEVIEVYGIHEVYNCTIDKTYTVGTGRSSDKRGGKLLITITNENVDIKSSRDSVNSGNLRLIVRTEVEIVAINDSMQFSYSVHSNKFSYATGNGQSKFRGGVGHIGKQVLTSGTCAET